MTETMVIDGLYGNGNACKVLVIGDWYAVEGSENVNYCPGFFLVAYDAANYGDPVDVEQIMDTDTATFPGGVHTLEDLETCLLLAGDMEGGEE